MVSRGPGSLKKEKAQESMTHDHDYFRRRAAEARASAFCKDYGEDVEVAGDLALAYAALARRRAKAAAPVDIDQPLDSVLTVGEPES
jgi:hypothetical protein